MAPSLNPSARKDSDGVISGGKAIFDDGAKAIFAHALNDVPQEQGRQAVTRPQNRRIVGTDIFHAPRHAVDQSTTRQDNATRHRRTGEFMTADRDGIDPGSEIKGLRIFSEG